MMATMQASQQISIGSVVWVEDDTLAWASGSVLAIKGDKAEVRKAGGGFLASGKPREPETVLVPLSRLQPQDQEAPNGGIDDMTKLAYLHEPGVLHNLAVRYDLDEIYTYTGSILIAVNPFAKLPHLYDASMMEQYRGAKLGELSPHVFAIAETAFKSMVDDKSSQSILVSGESGAGKTETTKLIMQYLAYMGGRAAADGRTVESQVLESNPLLEAFGNAKTVRNDNSSRFGKFVEIQFDQSNRISGAAVRTYLLEKSRVVQISDPERNYHCFYQLCAGATHEETELYKLGPPDSFHYLNQSSCIEIPGRESNADGYLQTKRAMSVVGVSPEEQETIFRIVAAILHLGNVNFKAGRDSDSSAIADDKSGFHLETVAELLRCDAASLEAALCGRSMVTMNEVILKTLDPEAAATSRDTLAKTIYSQLFDWLVQKINKSIGQDLESKYLIGVLDIYGFESFQNNSFEQFCINLANEKLQQHFNQHVFKAEQEEYEKEEIEWSYIDFVDNKDVLELLEKKPVGVLALLDEQCMFPKANFETLSNKLYQNLTNHKRFSKPKLSRTAFTIDHYAGQVTYQTEMFLEKNKDYVVAEHQSLLATSEDEFVAALFSLPPGEKTKTKFTSLGSSFKAQLQLLMETLNTTSPHYIRCVKPNAINRPGIFEHANVLQQLRCGGVLEAVRISCAGYPTRRTFDEFLGRFSILDSKLLEGDYDEKVAVHKLLEQRGLKNYQVGKSKVFLRAGQMADLDSMRQEKLNNAARVIQRYLRALLQRKAYARLKKATIMAQARWRGIAMRRKFDGFRREAAAIHLQKSVKGWLHRKAFLQKKKAACVLQAAARGMAARKSTRALRESRAALLIQSCWRRHLAQQTYAVKQRSIVLVQCVWRVKRARAALQNLKQEARQTGFLQEAKSKLEKQCEDLTWRLQYEKRLRVDAEEAKVAEVSRLQGVVDNLHAGVVEVQALLAYEKQERERDRVRLSELQLQPQVESRLNVDAAHELSELRAEVKEVEAQNQQLRALLDRSDTRAAEAESKVEESESVMGMYEESQTDLREVREELERTEEGMKNLEAENQVLRQQALTLTPTKSLSTPRMGAGALTPSPYYRGAYSSGMENGGDKGYPDSPAESGDRQQSEMEMRRQKVLVDRQQNDQEALLQCVVTDVGFSQGRPLASLIIYKSLLHWRSFEAERTNVFDRIIQTVGSAIEGQENSHVLGYWLSNTSTLLFLLQRTLKASGAAGAPLTSQTRGRKPTSTSLFGRMTATFRSPTHGHANGTGTPGESVRQVEAKYPALLFKQQLTAYVEKIYGMLRDNLKKDISPMLGSCIQAPRTARPPGGVRGSSNRSPGLGSTQALSTHWSAIITALYSLLNVMRSNRVPPFLVRKLFTQIFSFINVQLFNSLLLRRECCSFSNGEYVKAGLDELEKWIEEASVEFAGASWDELRFIRQAVGFLVLHQKPRILLEEITHDLCPVLSIQQLYRISTMYWDDKYGTLSVAPDVISSMRARMTVDANSNNASNSFLLDDDSRIPFSVDDISKSMTDLDLSDVDPPTLLRENPSFAFLLSQE